MGDFMKLELKIIWCKIGEIFWGCVAFVCKNICLFIEKHWEVDKKIDIQ